MDDTTKSEVLMRMATHALVAGATLPLGPMGQMLGAAGAVLFDAAAEADRRVWQRFNRMVEDASGHAGLDAAELHAWASRDDAHLNFVGELVSVALTTLDEQKAEALGRVLRDVLQDETLLQDRPLILRTLRDLDPIHVVVLRSMLWDDNPQDPDVEGVNSGDFTILSAHRWTYAALCAHHPGISGMLMINVLATLERQGLVARSERDTYTPIGYAIPVLDYLGGETE